MNSTTTENASYLLAEECEGEGAWEVLRAGQPLNPEAGYKKVSRAHMAWGIAGVIVGTILGCLALAPVAYLLRNMAEPTPSISALAIVIPAAVGGYFFGTEAAVLRALKNQKTLSLDTPLASNSKELRRTMLLVQSLGVVKDRSNLTGPEVDLVRFVKIFMTSKGQHTEASPVIHVLDEAIRTHHALTAARGLTDGEERLGSLSYKEDVGRLETLMGTLNGWAAKSGLTPSVPGTAG